MSPDGPGPGFLLVASPDLLDPNFQETVVLIVNHDDEGSYGLVLNRPVGRTLGEIAPELDPRAHPIPVLQGGPVQTDMLQFVGSQEGCGRSVVEGVVVGASLEEMLELSGEEPGIRAYAGYAGWGAGQLQAETEQGSWVVAPAAARHVFSVPAERLWATVLKELGGSYAWLALKRSEPSET